MRKGIKISIAFNNNSRRTSSKLKVSHRIIVVEDVPRASSQVQKHSRERVLRELRAIVESRDKQVETSRR